MERRQATRFLAIPSRISLTTPELLASVQSLYSDDLKPLARILVKRLRERAAMQVAKEHSVEVDTVDPETMPKINLRVLRGVCEQCKHFLVQQEKGNEFSVALVSSSHVFIDTYSREDTYPQQVWEGLESYFEELALEKGILRGGRYACAIALKRRLSLLSGYSLGQICHMIQLAIDQRRLLGYNGGDLVPYVNSESHLKEQQAAVQSPSGMELLPVADWDMTRTCLLSILCSGGIQISAVKRRFNTCWGVDLSVTALGHARLLDVLLDPRLSDMVEMQENGSGNLVVQLAKNFTDTSTFSCAWTPTPLQMATPATPSFHMGMAAVECASPLLSPGASPRTSSSPSSPQFRCEQDARRYEEITPRSTSTRGRAWSVATDSEEKWCSGSAKSTAAESWADLSMDDISDRLEELGTPAADSEDKWCSGFCAESTAAESCVDLSVDDSEEIEELDTTDDEERLWRVEVKNTFLNMSIPASRTLARRARSASPLRM